ncbi:hypothetical protein J19TS2_14950 [Cohnella xylanilytica]|uniref:Protein-export membrane protein SecG n=1 Tax=Cohnella xylanilytica TaxID=557555 RepID=A0A841U2H3_9BACL|nr:hypothetical protein [Cohnella xylanilytica]MBB6692164.1 hypothetical protein [Cohnella xylanilytica]GIO11940.1 hypothetical protein J19TS2_14950 [Cohnella xylanilytica]
MNVEILIVLVIVVMAAALIGTLMVGFSRGNREENPEYMKRTGKNWAKLTAIYAAVVLIVVLIFVAIWKS